MTIRDSIRQIRDTVNKGVFLNNLKRHDFLWDMVCASMDMIEDTQLAIEAYPTKSATTGQQYLDLYGLFQAMFMQQDALANLADGLRVSAIQVFKDPDSKYIRELRDRYFGHPSKHNHNSGKGITYHGLTRVTIGGGTIQGWTYPHFRTEGINIVEALKKHRSVSERILDNILKELIEKGNAYMSKFTKVLPVSDHHYQFEKLHVWALGTLNGEIMAKAAADILDQELDEIKQGVEARYEDADSVGDIIREISKAKYCLKVIKKGITESKTDTKNNFYFEAHIDALRQTYEEIGGICKDVNDNFNKKLEGN